MQAPVTAEEARVRRHRLQQRVISDAADRLMISTSVAWCTTMTILPLHRVKYMSQCLPEYQLLRKPVTFSGGFGAAMHIWKNEGLLKYWRGFTPAALSALPIVFAKQLATLNFAQDLQNSPSVAGSFTRGLAVSLIGATASTVFNILDMVHVKMATDLRYPEAFNLSSSQPAPNKKLTTFSPYKFRNWVHTAKQIYTINGSSKLFHGALPVFLYQTSHFFTLFGLTALTSLLGLDHVAPVLSTVTVSALAALISHPLDTIRNRMFFRLPTDIDYRIKPYQNTFECAKYIWDHEGMRGFMRGSGSAINIFVTSMIVSATYMTLVNNAKRDRLQREYLYKMHQYAQEERAQALETSRREIESLAQFDRTI
jgi:hypothetical protein